jgi:5-deoxy-D-glucuronate isomerase
VVLEVNMAEPCTKDYGSDPNQSFGLQRVYKLQSQLREKSIFQSDHDTAMKPGFVSVNGIQRNFMKMKI